MQRLSQPTLKSSLLFGAVFSCAAFFPPSAFAQAAIVPKAFVYTELQISVPFESLPWEPVNASIRQQPGFINKTWLSGLGNNSVGGFYAFDSIENALKYVTGYFPKEAKGLGVAQTTRVFDAGLGAEASRPVHSVYFGGKPARKPAAFVYAELQVRAHPFGKGAWADANVRLSKQPGLVSTTWLVGHGTGTTGGFFAFDSMESAKTFALDFFPSEAKAMKAAFYTRIFDAAKTESASRAMSSPFYP